MSKEKEKKLKFELVPDGCWCSNLRTILSKEQWNFIKADAKERAQYKCMICGRKTNGLDAHERWAYDEKKQVQKLVDVVAVCRDCHNAIHMERTHLKEDYVRAENHYMKVNECNYVTLLHDLGKANEEHQRRNLVSEWKLDLSWLKRFINEEE